MGQLSNGIQVARTLLTARVALISFISFPLLIPKSNYTTQVVITLTAIIKIMQYLQQYLEVMPVEGG